MYNNNNEFRPMKRSHSPDYEQNNYRNQHQRGGYHGGHHQFNNKRHRGDDRYHNNLPQTIEDRIASLGDSGAFNNQIGVLAKDIDADLAAKGAVSEEEKIKNITSKICICIVAFPTRIATYATLIGVISIKRYNLSCQIINTLHASYPVYLEAQKWQEALTIIHLLSTLVNCKVIRPSALLSQFELLLEMTLEDNIPQARSDYYVYTVLSSLPYVAQELSIQTEPNNFEQILTTIETYLSKRNKDHLAVTRVWLSNDSTVQMDYLDSLWVQTKNFRANGWNETFLRRPYNDKEYKDMMASHLILQNSPTIQIPAHSPDYIYPSPRIVFRLFEDDVTEGHKSIPGSDKIERFCIENHIRNIIDESPNEPKLCAKPHLLFMNRHDQLPMKHILIETILGELFTLPKPKHSEILYHSILVELGRHSPISTNPDELKFNYDVIMTEGVKVLYENLDTMNITCFDRFIEWFSFHLNNTEFLFPWQSWNNATGSNSPKAIFVREILNHCINFSFHKKISTLVNDHLASLMPPEVVTKYQPFYKDNPKVEELAATIKKLIVEKADGKTICETLNIIIDGVELAEDFALKDEKPLESLLKIDVFTAVILSIASKSLTHLSSAIGKYRNVFKALTKVQGGQIQLLQTMHSCLETHPQLQVILVDKLLKAELVIAKEVFNWIFSDSMKQHHERCYPWEILNNTIRRGSNALKKLVRERNKPVEVSHNDEGDDVEMKQEPDRGELDDKIKATQLAYSDLVFQVIGNFADIIEKHVKSCGASNTNYDNEWFRWMTGRLQQVYYNNFDLVLSKFSDLDSLVSKIPALGISIINLNK